MRTDTVAPLGYAGPGTRPPVAPAWRTFALRLVLVCWAGPLAVGLLTATTAGYAVVTGHRIPVLCVQVTAADVMMDLLLSLVGYVAILTFAVSRWSVVAGDRRRALVVPAVAATALLVSNYLVAFAVLWLGTIRR